MAMPPLNRPVGRTAAPVLKLRPTHQDSSLSSEAKKIIELITSDTGTDSSLNLESGSIAEPAEEANLAEPTKAEDEVLKRKAEGIDMRQPSKIRLLESFTETVKLIVGPAHDRETFIVHSYTLCTASPFFEARFKPKRQKGNGNVMELPEHMPRIFTSLLYWIYHNEIVYPSDPLTLFSLEDLAAFYLLAEKFQMPRLQNDVIDAMVFEMNINESFITLRYIQTIYESSSPASKLRILTVEHALDNWLYVGFRKLEQKDLPADFVFDIFLAFKKNSRAALDRDFLTSSQQHCESYHIYEVGQQGKCDTLKLPEHVSADS